jgi:hypothetical protein
MPSRYSSLIDVETDTADVARSVDRALGGLNLALPVK